LGENKLRNTVKFELPDLTAEVKKVEDYKLRAALFRDYSMLTSAYLLEDSHQTYM